MILVQLILLFDWFLTFSSILAIIITSKKKISEVLYVWCILANGENCISDCSESYQIIWDFFTQIRSSIAATILWKQILGGRRQYKKTGKFNKELYKTSTSWWWGMVVLVVKTDKRILLYFWSFIFLSIYLSLFFCWLN